MTRDRLVVFGPLPPSPSGIADYFFEQIPYLEERASVTAVVDDKQDLSIVKERYPSLDVKRISEWNAHQDSNLLLLHHLGNNPAHDFVHDALCRYPGVVVLHDLVQHHRISEMTLGHGDQEGYRDLMAAELGSAGALAADDRAAGVFSEFQQFLMPLNRAIILRARGVIVHSRWAQQAIEDLGTDVPVTSIPHHFAAPDGAKVGHADARRELGIPAGQLAVAALGYITPPKQVSLLLQALSSLQGQLRSCHLYLVGEPHDHDYWSNEISRSGIGDRVTVTGYVPLEQLFRYAEAADVVVNLRYPSAGETSGTLVRALGTGASCIVFDYGPFSDYPDDVVCKVPLTTHDPAPLASALANLLADPHQRGRLAARARSYVDAKHNIGACVREYLTFVRRCRAEKTSNNELRGRWSRAGLAERRLDQRSLLHIVEAAAAALGDPKFKRYFLAAGHCDRVATTLSFVPVAEEGMRALEIGSYQIVVPCLHHVLQYREVYGTIQDPTRPGGRTTQLFEWNGHQEEYPVSNGDLEITPLCFPDSFMDVVLCGEVIEHMSRDPMYLLAEINRVLKPGGLMVVTTPNITSLWSLERLLMGHWPYLYPVYTRFGSTDRHNVEYSPRELGTLLEAAGFSVQLETHNSWTQPSPFIEGLVSRAGYSRELRADNIFAICVKMSRVVERYPIPSYDDGEREFQWSNEVAVSRKDVL